MAASKSALIPMLSEARPQPEGKLRREMSEMRVKANS